MARAAAILSTGLREQGSARGVLKTSKILARINFLLVIQCFQIDLRETGCYGQMAFVSCILVLVSLLTFFSQGDAELSCPEIAQGPVPL